MSVHPGFGGQKFIEETKEKINILNIIRKNFEYNYEIEIDGGVNIDTKDLCSGADRLVVGSYITTSDEYKDRFNLMK